MNCDKCGRWIGLFACPCSYKITTSDNTKTPKEIEES